MEDFADTVTKEVRANIIYGNDAVYGCRVTIYVTKKAALRKDYMVNLPREQHSKYYQNVKLVTYVEKS